jgi:CENP-B N-terminal DNA-binding domain.
MVSKDTKMCKQGAVGKSKHVTLIMPQKLRTVTRCQSGERQREVMSSYNMGLSTIYDVKRMKDQLQSLMASSECMKGLCKSLN